MGGHYSWNIIEYCSVDYCICNLDSDTLTEYNSCPTIMKQTKKRVLTKLGIFFTNPNITNQYSCFCGQRLWNQEVVWKMMNINFNGLVIVVIKPGNKSLPIVIFTYAGNMLHPQSGKTASGVIKQRGHRYIFISKKSTFTYKW